jgi:hypothetical protein
MSREVEANVNMVAALLYEERKYVGSLIRGVCTSGLICFSHDHQRGEKSYVIQVSKF